MVRKLVLSISERTEFWLVILLAFGFPIWGSVSFAFTHYGARLVTSDQDRLFSCAFQLAIFGLVVWISRIRGWSIRQLGLRPSWRLTGVGILLFPVMVVILFGLAIALRSLVPSSFFRPHGVAVDLSLVGVLVTSIVNPPFEEILVCGYIIHRLAEKGAGVAITLSAFVRLLYHVHLGPSSLGVLLLGFIFGCLYWRFRQLWPLIVAHSLIDLLGLLLLARKI